MSRSRIAMTLLAAGVILAAWATATPRLQAENPQMPTPRYTQRFVTVAPGVEIQVLDWGGSGRPVILLAGLGLDAHEFDGFAPKLTSRYHVYAISRRGFGQSSAPTPNCENYSATRLADDVLAVMQALKIRRPAPASAPLLISRIAIFRRPIDNSLHQPSQSCFAA